MYLCMCSGLCHAELNFSIVAIIGESSFVFGLDWKDVVNKETGAGEMAPLVMHAL